MEKIVDFGIILNIIEHGNSSCIVTLFSKHHGIISGYIKGGLKNQRKNNCFVGNYIEFTWLARVLSQLGNIEISNLLQNFSTVLEFRKSIIVQVVCEVLSSVLKKNDAHSNLFDIVFQLFSFIKIEDSPLKLLHQYILFENSLLEEIGFGYNFSQCNISGGIPKYISPKTGNVVSAEIAKSYESRLFLIPDFIINAEIEPSLESLKKMLDINLHFLKYHLDIKNFPIRNFMLSIF